MPPDLHNPAHDEATRTVDVDMLVEQRNMLIANLSVLDHAGEHIAAAYLAAAIDALETRLDALGRAVPHTRGGIVADFAQRLSERLGTRAVEVARAQQALATGPTLLIWTAIVNQLERADA